MHAFVLVTFSAINIIIIIITMANELYKRSRVQTTESLKARMTLIVA